MWVVCYFDAAAKGIQITPVIDDQLEVVTLINTLLRDGHSSIQIEMVA